MDTAAWAGGRVSARRRSPSLAVLQWWCLPLPYSMADQTAQEICNNWCNCMQLLLLQQHKHLPTSEGPMTSSYNIVESHSLQQKIADLIFYCVFSSLHDIARLESWKGRKERNDAAPFALHPFPPSPGCIPPDVKVDRAVFKQAQDPGHSFFICSASPISQIYCSCERQLSLSCRARLPTNA